MPDVELADLVAAAADLADGPGRRILGITGAPGAGKSVLAALLAEALGDRVAIAGMDGFHLAQAELQRLGRAPRKGAPDTFDASGFVALLRRLRAADEPVVYAPRFDRSLEEPIGSSVPIRSDVPLVITEGNYLLLADGPWTDVLGLLDECWFVDVDDAVRLERLIARHVAYGRSAADARERSLGSDMRNATIIAAGRSRATRVVQVPTIAGLSGLT